MPRYHIISPDGKEFEIDAPDGATEEDAVNYLQTTYKPEQQWGDVGTQALKNLPKSIQGVGQGVIDTVAHPIDTTQSMLDLANAGMQKVLPASINSLMPEKTKQNPAKLDAAANFYKNRYGGESELKQTLANDPAGALLDAVTAISLGSAALKPFSNKSNLANELANIEKAKALNAPKAEILAEAIRNGYVMPPSAVNPSFINKRLESAAGKNALRQESIIRNQEGFVNPLVRKELGIAENIPINGDVLRAIRENAGGVYKEVSELPIMPELSKGYPKTTGNFVPIKTEIATYQKTLPENPELVDIPIDFKSPSGYNFASGKKGINTVKIEAPNNSIITDRLTDGNIGIPKGVNVVMKPATIYKNVEKITSSKLDLEALKQARNDAKAWRKTAEIQGGNPEIMAKAREAENTAAMLEKRFEDRAAAAGKPDLVNQLRDARKEIAKTYTVDSARNVATGDIDPIVLGRIFDSEPDLLSGNLKTIGQTQQTFPQYLGDATKVPTPGVGKAEALASGIMATTGAAGGGAPGILAGGIPLISEPIRKLILSKWYQEKMLKYPEQSASKLPQLQALLPDSKGVNKAALASILYQMGNQ